MPTTPVPATTRIGKAGAPSRKQASSARQRISTAVLVIGTALSLGSLAGPDWMLRIGIVIALASAAVSCALAWRELHLARRQHAQDLLAASRRHAEQLSAARQHNTDVLDTVSSRARRWRGEVDRQQTQIAGLRVEVTALRADAASMRHQLKVADGVITGLRETVRERDLELALTRPAERAAAEVHTLPRRVRFDRAAVDAAVGAAAGAVDSVGSPRRTLFGLHPDEPALPNFEADRRRA